MSCRVCLDMTYRNYSTFLARKTPGMNAEQL
ncbi:MAG: hypothetical protein LZF60_140062 [Nitrospira sp.]|nr:MAG: hypothetical protein LZF60_140062 [Nitrospira sp.]